MRQLKEQHADWGAVKVSQALGLSLDHAKLHLARWIGVQSFKGAVSGGAQVSSTPAQPAGSLRTGTGEADLLVSGDDDEQNLTYQGSRIRTLEDLLAYTQTDTRIWEVERYVINKWEMGTKIGGEVLTEPLYQIKVWMRRKILEHRLQSLMDGLLEKFKTAAPLRAASARPHGGAGMLEISLMDMHLGKLSWAPETGYDYNVDIAEKMFLEALEDLLSKASGLDIGRVLFVCGNDFLNTDHLGRATTAGTPRMRWCVTRTPSCVDDSFWCVPSTGCAILPLYGS